jgi:hypothetical protein
LKDYLVIYEQGRTAAGVRTAPTSRASSRSVAPVRRRRSAWPKRSRRISLISASAASPAPPDDETESSCEGCRRVAAASGGAAAIVEQGPGRRGWRTESEALLRDRASDRDVTRSRVAPSLRQHGDCTSPATRVKTRRARGCVRGRPAAWSLRRTHSARPPTSGLKQEPGGERGAGGTATTGRQPRRRRITVRRRRRLGPRPRGAGARAARRPPPGSGPTARDPGGRQSISTRRA